MHNESLTRRVLLGRLDLLKGAPGLGSGLLCAPAGVRKFGRLRLRITLQGLVFLEKILELLLNLAESGLLLLALDALLGRSVFGLGQRFLEGCHFGRGP